MQKSQHINVFDFDETLFRVPGYSCKEAAGLEPYEWYDSPDSLDEEFNIRGIQNTIDRTKEDCHNMLVTHRVDETRLRVMEILLENNLMFHEIHFLGRGSKKAETVIKSIEALNPKSVTIFEDSLWEIICYTSYFLDAGLRSSIDFVFYFVDKSKIIKIDWQTAIALEERAEVERLKIL